jgi:hypothetical protein
MAYSYDRRQAAGGKLDNAKRRKINEGLRRAGLDGNGRFGSVSHGINAALDVLYKFGLEEDEPVTAPLNKDQGRKNIRLAFKTKDPFSPESITNTVLTLSWMTLSEGKVEVVAYLS